MEHLSALCEILSLSLDDAIAGNSAEAATATEQLILNGVRELDDASQQYLLATIEMLKKKP